MQSSFEPKPSGRGTKFYIHLSNWAEFLSWMSAGIAVAFVVQIAPKLLLIYPIAFILTITYFASNIPHNKTASLLRIAAVFCSLFGFWNLVWLYRDTVSAVVVGAIALIIVGGGYVLWLKLR